MGAVSPIMSVLPVLSTVGTVLGAVNKNLNLFDSLTGRSDKRKLDQVEEKLRLQQQTALQNAIAQQNIDAEQSTQAESERREALRRAVARQRASFGSQGVGSSGGSADAVLLGLFEESDDEREKRGRLDALRSQATQTGLSGKYATNLLKATDAADKQNLKRYYLF